MRHICLLLVMLAALGAKAQTVAADSLERAVAVFFASQFKVAYNNGLADVRATGIEIDSAAVLRLIAQEITQPYDSLAQDRAFELIDKAANAAVIASSKDMLEAAAKAEGATVLPSGVVVETITPGSGDNIKRSDIIEMRYIGRLPDGTVFDSIPDSEEPMRSIAGQFVPGMTEGLTQMKRGGRYIITIPADKAYGEHGVQGIIPPNCALQFEITLYN
ncbi:MAG: FKBP-type peptidyl-prolyl cis-trans isomerase [Muribaculaceae bacterium]|nr:FKBP-type peptidyl-prolyl cis-trans isomerase [Muribaculaceae bacterium]